jgi:hypothetical protein
LATWATSFSLRAVTMDCSARRRELLGDGAADASSAAGYNHHLFLK